MTNNIIYCLCSSENQPIREAKRMFILPQGYWKDNTRSVILDWGQRCSGRSNKGEITAGFSGKRRHPLVTQADLSAPGVCSPAIALLRNKGPRHRRKICANSLWLYYCYPQSSPSMNKNINCIFKYLRVRHYFSSGTFCDILEEEYWYNLAKRWRG